MLALAVALVRLVYWTGVRVVLALARSSVWRWTAITGLASLWLASGGRW